MPRPSSDNPRSERVELRASPTEKALLTRAAALAHLDVTSFIMRAALPEAESIIAAAERVDLGERDSLFVLDLLENPPPPPARLVSAARTRLERS